MFVSVIEKIKESRISQALKATNKFGYLLLALFALLFIHPYIQGDQLLHEEFLMFFITLILFAAVYAVRNSKSQFLIACIIGVPTLIFNILSLFSVSPLTLHCRSLLLIIFLLFTLFTIFLHVIKSRRNSLETLLGAICIYLLIGVTWAIIYGFVETTTPGSFSLDDHPLPSHFGWFRFIYFSFVTLTTLGYGEITPETPVSQSLAILEALLGVLCIAILVGRLVTTYQSYCNTSGQTEEECCQ